MAGSGSEEPVMRSAPLQKVDKLATKINDKADVVQGKIDARRSTRQNTGKESKGPAGGFDATPIPHAPPGYTLKITFHRAENLPFADFGTFSSDPYILAALRTDLQKRHKQDPDLRLRTKTIHRNTNPVWEQEWIVANIPASGFFLKCRLYDEDPADHDDRLGNVHVNVGQISDGWKGFREQKFELKKRMGSKRAYTFRGCAALVSRRIKMGGDLIVSVENLGRTPGDEGGRSYTIGPLSWSQHYSPLIGRLTGTKSENEGKDGEKGTESYNFQAIQMQLEGPVPADLYHRYVEFKPFVAGMFTAHSLRGRVLNRALHHQHARIYNYDRSTKYGLYDKPCLEMTRRFLDFVHYDQGGRIYTYVLTLDAQWRFTETGKEFGIDLLSKHTMHSDVSIYIAFSGEFFIRRLKHPHTDKNKSPDPSSEALPPAPDEDSQSEDQQKKGPNKDPNMYELVIDNDSGTYRPNAKKLSALKKFMSANLPGIRVVTLDSQGDADKMKRLKDEQREKKKASGKQITYLQNSSMSSISSSDEEELNERANGAPHEHKYKKEYHKYLGHGEDSYHGGPYSNEGEGNQTSRDAPGNTSGHHHNQDDIQYEKQEMEDRERSEQSYQQQHQQHQQHQQQPQGNGALPEIVNEKHNLSSKHDQMFGKLSSH